MNNSKNMWATALMTFGFFMIMGAPIMGNQILMIISGLFFVALAAIIMKYNKK